MAATEDQPRDDWECPDCGATFQNITASERQLHKFDDCPGDEFAAPMELAFVVEDGRILALEEGHVELVTSLNYGLEMIDRHNRQVESDKRKVPYIHAGPKSVVDLRAVAESDVPLEGINRGEWP